MGIGACLRRWGGLAADELGDLDFFGDAEFLEQPDAIVVGVELVPGEAVAGRRRDGRDGCCAILRRR